MERDNNNDEEDIAAPQDIRSRIAAFEQNSSALGGPVSSSKTHAQATSGGGSSRTTVPQGKYDPLQAMSSPPKSNEPTIIKLAERPRGGSSAPSGTGTSNKPSSSTASNTTRVALPGLGARTPSSSSVTSAAASSTSASYTPNAVGRPSSLSQSRPWPPVKQEPSSPSSDIGSAIHTAMADTPPVGNLSKAPQSVPSQGASTPAPRPTPSPSSSVSLPPPQLPSRKNSNASATSVNTSFSSFTNFSSLNSEPSSLNARIPPPLPGGKPASSSSNVPRPVSEASASNTSAPRLPPRKQGSTSSSISTSSALDALPRPPQRNTTMSAASSPSGTPVQSRSSSVSQYTPNPPSRTTTPQSDMSGRSNGAPFLSALPPRPREQSMSISRNLPPPPHRTGSRDSTSSVPPPPPLLAARPNGLPKAAAGSESPPKRYEALWDKLTQTFAHPQRTTSASDPRLDAIVVRQVWKMSKLSDATLGRIWTQCDVNRQGSLDKAGFCKGLALIDNELGTRRRRRK
ncbi:hypothetical protein P389DRAFT_197855 [Cystobasidium minutum MCA 4210]|uniref:uncharacterized protein n=1 Tax=Cystobasidium minutum MCA 4210 TaxID=1397322 RepID=UPI0034CD234A|eukprot:jgi/Rhomi1/197855/gm1.6069_g